jgi:hypothetical protein
VVTLSASQNPIKHKIYALKGRNKSELGSANVEFVLLAIPLFIPILIFLNYFSTLSNAELVARSLVRESLRAYVTSDNPFVAMNRANQVLVEAARTAGLKDEEIKALELDFDCSKVPCLSPGGRIRAILKLPIPNQERIVKAEAEEFISPWQWNGIGIPAIPTFKVDM